MSGKSPILASKDQQADLSVLASSRNRGETDRARAKMLAQSGWTSGRIAEAFGIREDMVRLWRSDFMEGGVGAVKATVASGLTSVKSEAALRIAMPLLSEPVADRHNWTIPRLRAEIAARKGASISRWRRHRHTLTGRQVACEIEQAGLRLHLGQEGSGPVRSSAWAGQESCNAGFSRSQNPPAHRHTSKTQAQL